MSIVTINSRKFDGSLSRSWQCKLERKNGSLLEFVGVFDEEVDHPDLGIIRRGTVSIEYYWLDRWYNVFRFESPEGVLRNFYCNINVPPRLTEGCLDYVDLDIDVLISPSFDITVLDMNDFEINAKAFGYGDEIRQKALDARDEVIELARGRRFPFDR